MAVPGLARGRMTTPVEQNHNSIVMCCLYPFMQRNWAPGTSPITTCCVGFRRNTVRRETDVQPGSRNKGAVRKSGDGRRADA